jgi:xylan 1,4-beta-xylosidase
MKYTNPIIPGFYPDPSICGVEQDYYLVTSSFEYFPGVPIFHSRDLVHWKQIGHCLTRASQLPLENAGSSRGIFAPTIRYHNGRFYMVTTNVSVGKHFFVYTDDPTGEWSEPVWLEGDGIDSSLYFDDDGKVYFTWTNFSGIYQYELDIKTGKPLSEPRTIWHGTGGRYPEAPHLYKVNHSTYYLMIAEGGTEYGHMVTIARSDSPWGPFEPCPNNPILTHRNQGANLIQGTGHADLIQDHNGRWWVVFLAFRPLRQYQNYHHLGRETFLAPVEWRGEWPVIARDGLIFLEMEGGNLTPQTWEAEPIRDDFDNLTLNFQWNFLRNPRAADWSLSERPGWLRLKGSDVTLDDVDSPAFVARRQQHFDCKVSVRLDFSPTREGEEAGLTVLMNEKHHYEIAVGYQNNERIIFVRRRIGDLSAIVAQETLPAGLTILQIEATPEHYTFSYAPEGEAPRSLATGSTRYLSSEVAGGFTGVYFGMFASGGGQPASTPADFDWFDYQPT